MRWVVVLTAVAAAGCLKAGLVECPNDVLCPVGSVCDVVHGGCITPAQSEACVGTTNNEACTAGSVIGYCLDEICIDPGCGNFVIDDGELCDDGNRVDGDGCSGSCLSREVCGDGFVNADLGEECDDGSLQSHDGCDSRCLVETAVWTYDEIGPVSTNQSQTTFDATRGKTVVVTDGFVWGWNGTRWMVLAADAPDLDADYDIVFDKSRGTLLAIFERPPQSDFLLPDPPRERLYEWDGTTWTFATTTNPPEARTAEVTYDTVRNRVFLFGVNFNNDIVTAQLDVATRAWSSVSPPTMPAGFDLAYRNIGIAFDESRGRVVVAIAGSSVPSRAPMVLEWNGTTWAISEPAMAALSGWQVIYDPVLRRVVALGGRKSPTTSAAQSWTGSGWVSLPDIPGMRIGVTATFDTTRQLRVVLGGSGGGFGASDPDAVVEGAQSTWTPIARIAPPPRMDNTCAFDEVGRRLVCVGPNAMNETETETWAWTGTWAKLAAPTPGPTPRALAFDPVRGVVVGVGGIGLVALINNAWVVLAAEAPLYEGTSSIVFDPTTQELVTVLTSDFDGNPTLTRIAQDNSVRLFPSGYYESLAFDARNRVVVGLGIQKTSQLVDGTWTTIVGPGNSYRATTNARRGTVEFIAPGAPIVERVGTSWIDRPELPPFAITGSSIVDQSTGELLVLGRKGASRFMLRRRWESATPFETCGSSDDDDVDGDGLAGCADPDCWTTCAPLCSPFVSCP